MGRRTVYIKTKDTENGNRAELLCAIAWLTVSPEDKIVKSSKRDDIENHIDYYVHKPDGKIITYDAKARRFENYGQGFSADYHFVAEIKNRQGIDGSIYGKQDFMAHEIYGKFIFIKRKLIQDMVDKYVKPTAMKVDRMDSMYGNIYSNPRLNDGHELTAFAFSEFQTKELPIPEEFHARQFNYTLDELIKYILKHNLNIQL